MKKIILILTVMMMILGMSACDVLETPLGSRPSNLTQINPSLNPTLSHQGGFYDTAFELTITPKKNTTIYLTFDGSIPTKDSIVYQNPIFLEETYIVADGSEIIITENTTYDGPISMIRTTSSRWQSPKEDIFKAHTIRIMALDSMGNQSEVLTHTYFVHHDIYSLYTFPIMSLSTDRKHLFDYHEGINVPGAFFDDSIENERNNRTGNYFMRGIEWEKPVFVEYYDVLGQLQMALDAGMRIHGGLSRKYPLKSYRLYARKEYSKTNSFNYPFFDNSDDDAFKRLILRGFGQAYEYTLFGEAAAHKVLEPLKLDIQQSAPVILFINGEYFGIRNVRERLDQHYIERHYQINPSDLTMLVGQGYLDYGQAIGSAQYMSMYHFITTRDMNQQANYLQAEQQMDMDNFIDYNIAQLFFANMDWPQNNVLYWKKNVRYNPNAPYGHDGRWRWMVFDLDAGFAASWGGNRPDINSFERLTGDSWKTGELLLALMNNQEFKAKFVYRLLELSETLFHPDRTTQIIREMKLAYIPEINDHIARWGFPQSYNTWDNYVTRMTSFAIDRNTHFINHMEAFFGIDARIEIKIISDDSKGYLVVNGIENYKNEIVESVYENLPIIVEAKAMPGYHLSHYEDQNGNRLSNQSKLVITPNQGLEIVAVFAIGEPKRPLISSNAIRQTMEISIGLWILFGYHFILTKDNLRKIKKYM
jgi:hypothetical protein